MDDGTRSLQTISYSRILQKISRLQSYFCPFCATDERTDQHPELGWGASRGSESSGNRGRHLKLRWRQSNLESGKREQSEDDELTKTSSGGSYENWEIERHSWKNTAVQDERLTEHPEKRPRNLVALCLCMHVWVRHSTATPGVGTLRHSSEKHWEKQTCKKSQVVYFLAGPHWKPKACRQTDRQIDKPPANYDPPRPHTEIPFPYREIRRNAFMAPHNIILSTRRIYVVNAIGKIVCFCSTKRFPYNKI